MKGGFGKPAQARTNKADVTVSRVALSTRHLLQLELAKFTFYFRPSFTVQVPNNQAYSTHDAFPQRSR